MNIKYILFCGILLVSSINFAQNNIPQSGRAPIVHYAEGVQSFSPTDTFCVAAYCYDVNDTSIFILGGCPGGFLSYWSPPTIPNAGVRGGNGNYYILETGPPTTLWQLDTLTGEVTLLGEITGMEPGATGKGLAYNPVNDSYYMCAGVSLVSNDLYELDVNTLAAAYVAGFPVPNEMMIAIAIDSSGTGFGYDIVNDLAYTFNPITGSSALLGSIGFDANYAQDMDFDLSSGTLYLTAFNNSTFTGQLRIMDPNTGNTVLVGELFHQVSVIEYNNPYSIIPVELTSFTAQVNKQDVKLEWTTATETNNRGFELQRSEDVYTPSQWETLVFVKGKGTTAESQQYEFTDQDLSAGKYNYRLKQIDFNGTINYSEEVNVDIQSVLNYGLNQNYPNPFNPVTTIRYSIPVKSFVYLEILNALGERIGTLINREKQAGNYTVQFNAENLPSGIYFYRLSADSFVETKKMILLK